MRFGALESDFGRKGAGKQELCPKQHPEALEKLIEIAKAQSTEASNVIDGIVTTSTHIH